MLTCKDVATAIGQDEWREAPRWRRLALQLHLLMCPYCRRYADQIPRRLVSPISGGPVFSPSPG